MDDSRVVCESSRRRATHDERKLLPNTLRIDAVDRASTMIGLLPLTLLLFSGALQGRQASWLHECRIFVPRTPAPFPRTTRAELAGTLRGQSLRDDVFNRFDTTSDIRTRTYGHISCRDKFSVAR